MADPIRDVWESLQRDDQHLASVEWCTQFTERLPGLHSYVGAWLNRCWLAIRTHIEAEAEQEPCMWEQAILPTLTREQRGDVVGTEGSYCPYCGRWLERKEAEGGQD